jgi:preprotein translocase subunit YajC
MQSNNSYTKKDLPLDLRNLGFTLLVGGIILGIIAFFLDETRAIFNYLLSFVFIVSIVVGCLFLVALEYVAGADWSTPIRRVSEFISSFIPLLVILVIPLLFSMHDLFHWTHEEAVESDKILQGKSPYLNTEFFIIRTVLFFVIWNLFYFIIIRNSRKQDKTGDQSLTKKNIIYSAIFIPLFAITITFFSIDWMMSLEPHWFSTIFGVYFFAGSVVGALAAVTLATVLLKEKGYLHPKMVDDHYYSLGALLFAFINFWGYIAFSQYLLIWYANLPEETFWFLARWEGGWIFMSIFLIIIHFVVPYSLLLSQPAKMNPKRLKFVSVWILFAHLIDLYWLIMPQMHSGKSGYFYTILEFAFPIAAIGGLILVFFFNSKKQNLVPVGDPKLDRGLNFRL